MDHNNNARAKAQNTTNNNDTHAHYLDNTSEITADSVNIKPDERRQYCRRAARWMVTLMTREQTAVSCRTRDVSERGVSIASPYDFAAGTRVVVEISISYKTIRKPIRVIGEVRHSSIASTGFTLGILFKDITAPAQDFLKKYAEETI